MVADLWKKTPEQIARRVIGLRVWEGSLEQDPPAWEDFAADWERLDTGKPIRRGDR